MSMRRATDLGKREVFEASEAARTLPGEDLVQAGLADLERRRVTVASLLVSIGAPRLAALGVRVPDPLDRPEHRLYAMLRESDAAGAHGRYNALVRRLVSYERALACAT